MSTLLFRATVVCLLPASRWPWHTFTDDDDVFYLFFQKPKWTIRLNWPTHSSCSVPRFNKCPAPLLYRRWLSHTAGRLAPTWLLNARIVTRSGWCQEYRIPYARLTFQSAACNMALKALVKFTSTLYTLFPWVNASCVTNSSLVRFMSVGFRV